MVGRTNTGGGGSGATLTIIGVAGATVIASKNGKTYTRTINNSGAAVFKGLSTGTWTVTMSSDGQTATRTLEITADYSLSITYFSATITITYPANSTCVVTDSSGATIASNTNTGTDTKTWTATVNATGTYTVTATATDGSGKSKSQSVSITADGQSVSVALSYETYIYKHGETDITLSSSWELPSSPPVNDWRYSGDSVSLESDGSIKSSGGKLVRALKVDLTDVNELFFEVKVSAYKYKGHVGVATAWPYSNSDFTYVAKTNFADTTDVQIVMVDTSALTGEYWVGGYFAPLTTTNLYNIWY